jgi:hypothetical protein
LFIHILLWLSTIPAFAGLAVFSGSTPPDPMKGHYMMLAAFGAYAIHLHFGIVPLVIEIKIIQFCIGSKPTRLAGITGFTRFKFFNFLHYCFRL